MAAAQPLSAVEHPAIIAPHADPQPAPSLKASVSTPATLSSAEELIVAPEPAVSLQPQTLAASGMGDLAKGDAAHSGVELPHAAVFGVGAGIVAASHAAEVVAAVRSDTLQGAPSQLEEPPSRPAPLQNPPVPADLTTAFVPDHRVDAPPGLSLPLQADAPASGVSALAAELPSDFAGQAQKSDAFDRQFGTEAPYRPPPLPYSAAGVVHSEASESLAAKPAALSHAFDLQSPSFGPSTYVESRLPAMVDAQIAGWLDFRQTLGGLHIRVGSLVDLLKDRFAASELERLGRGPAINSHLSLKELRNAGIPITYDPVRDAFALTVAPTGLSNVADAQNSAPIAQAANPHYRRRAH